MSARRTIPDRLYAWSDDPTLALVIIDGRASHGLVDNRNHFERFVERFKAIAAEYDALSVVDKQRALNSLGLLGKVGFGEGQ